MSHGGKQLCGKIDWPWTQILYLIVALLQGVGGIGKDSPTFLGPFRKGGGRLTLQWAAGEGVNGRVAIGYVHDHTCSTLFMPRLLHDLAKSDCATM